MKGCIIDGCEKKDIAKGYCTKHSTRFYRYGDPNIIYRTGRPSRRCSISDCNRKHEGLGYCVKHYQRFKKYGVPTMTYEILHDVQPRKCSLSYCNRKYSAKGLCINHYQQMVARKKKNPSIKAIREYNESPGVSNMREE